MALPVPKEEKVKGLMAKDDVKEDMKYWKMLEHLCVLGDVRSRPGDDVPLVSRTNWALYRSSSSLMACLGAGTVPYWRGEEILLAHSIACRPSVVTARHVRLHPLPSPWPSAALISRLLWLWQLPPSSVSGSLSRPVRQPLEKYVRYLCEHRPSRANYFSKLLKKATIFQTS